MSHLLLMTAYAALVALFFALLWKNDKEQRIRFFLQAFLWMVVGGFVVAWLMYFFPSAPPAPIP